MSRGKTAGSGWRISSRRSRYRAWAWCQSELIPWGDWGRAVMLEVSYAHPRQDTPITIHQAVRVRRQPNEFELRVGRRAELVCWGVMPSGMLRHPLFVRWST